MNKALIIRIVIVLGVYFFLRYLGGWFGQIVLYPITMLVTYLHELGHAIGAIITGGKPQDLQINRDGSGQTVSIGGSKNVILMGGYLGSIIFGNIMIATAVRLPRISRFVLKILSLSMAVAALVWFSNMETSVILVVFAIILYYSAEKTEWQSEILLLLGLLCVAYIIQDFNVGPSSDIAEFSANTFINSPTIWMGIWLILACGITFLNIRYILWNRFHAAEVVLDNNNNPMEVIEKK
jgi:hypothetical protein